MKKTERTALTAALFAAALNFIPTGTSDMNSSAAGNDAAPVGVDEYVPEADEPIGMYGPPWMFETTTAPTTEPLRTDVYPVYGPEPAWTTVTPVSLAPTTEHPLRTDVYPVYGTQPAWTTVTPTTSYDPETDIPLPVYGPPPVLEKDLGDLDDDGKITAFDMVLLRQKYINRDFDMSIYARYDVDQDGIISVADLVMLQRYLLGQINSLGYSDPQPQPVYGPPSVMYDMSPESQNEDTSTTTTAADIPSDSD